MSGMTQFAISAILLGGLATALMDVFCFAREYLFKTPAPNYAPVGRWMIWLAHGTFFHRNIAATPPVKGELLIGWLTHYAVGIAFAAALLALFGLDWLRAPTLIPALIIGIGSVAAPFFVMQPGMGSGIAASKTPDPTAARIRSLVLHTVFGVALYVAGWVMQVLSS